MNTTCYFVHFAMHFTHCTLYSLHLSMFIRHSTVHLPMCITRSTLHLAMYITSSPTHLVMYITHSTVHFSISMSVAWPLQLAPSLPACALTDSGRPDKWSRLLCSWELGHRLIFAERLAKVDRFDFEFYKKDLVVFFADRA